MKTLPIDIKSYIEYLCDKNKHFEHIKSLNEEFKTKFVNKLVPPFLLLRQTIYNLDIHDEYTTFSCYYISLKQN